MKKIHKMTVLLLSCLSLAACGGQKDSGESTWRGIQAGMDDLSAIINRTEYYDIVAEREPIFQWEQETEGSPLSIRTVFIGMQFYQGEPVQLWGEPVQLWAGADSFSYVWDICLYRQDGSRKVLLPRVEYPSSCHGYLDRDGNFYWWRNTRYTENGQILANTFLKKYSPSGELLFEKQMEAEQNIMELRQTADGRMYLTLRDRETESRWLTELDAATGLITELKTGQLAGIELGISGDKPALFKSANNNIITEVNVSDGTESCFLSFRGTSYVLPKNYSSLQDFRILEDESVEILWAAYDGSGGIWEKLRMAKVEKTPIVLRGLFTDSWLSAQISSFNQSSETYHVIVEVPGNDPEDFARLTSIQIASGKGPDILCGSLMKDYIPGMMEKGALEDLYPYMERNGIREKDYFPYVFATWRSGEKIYSVNSESPVLTGYLLDSSVLGGTEEPDIVTLVDILLSRQEDAVFLEGYDSQELLELLLEGTDTLWGMVDWEKGSCDFSGELFAGILETAKRYGDNGVGEKNCIAQARSFNRILFFDDRAERERDGKVICGVMFDDGCHVAVTSRTTLAVNANSANKEGVWEFISILLEDEAQSVSVGIPASRNAFDIWVKNQKEKVADGKEIHMMFSNEYGVKTGVAVYTEEDITEDIIEEFVETLEDARPYPIRTAPILDIISEEAANYFNGSKSAAEVGKVVANRVQTYLDEGR